MNIEEYIAQVRSGLDRLSQYEHMIDANNFESDTVEDMKGNAEDICDQLKTIIDDIKAAVDQWS